MLLRGWRARKEKGNYNQTDAKGDVANQGNCYTHVAIFWCMLPNLMGSGTGPSSMTVRPVIAEAPFTFWKVRSRTTLSSWLPLTQRAPICWARRITPTLSGPVAVKSPAIMTWSVTLLKLIAASNWLNSSTHPWMSPMIKTRGLVATGLSPPYAINFVKFAYGDIWLDLLVGPVSVYFLWVTALCY